MEEDIKILEEKIRNVKKYNTYSYSWTNKDIEIVENLILGYKELDKENDNLRDTNKKLYEMGQRQAMQLLIEDEYIKKSKVKEKIKKLKKEKKAPITIQWEMEDMIEAKIQVLQELLEDYENHIPRID